MKIAFDHQIFNMQPYGGISRFYTNLAQELLNLKQEVGVFAGVHRNNYLADLPSDVVRGAKLASYPPKTGRIFRTFNHYLVNHRIRNWNPDLIHETYYSSMSFLESSIPRVTTAYDMIHELFPRMFSKRDKTSDWKHKTFERVDHIISISQSTKNDLVELFGIDEEKISVVHLGVDDAFFLNYKIDINVKSDRPFLLYVGARSGYKNFRVVLRVISASKRLKQDFDFVAFGGGAFNVGEKAFISSLGFKEGQVRQIGGHDDELVELYHRATAFVYPSLYEGFGLPPLESMACSCPVISSNTSSMPEVIGDAGEYFSPSDNDDIQRAIESVVYSSDRLKKLKKKGLERIQFFGWDKCARETLEIYKRVLEQKCN